MHQTENPDAGFHVDAMWRPGGQMARKLLFIQREAFRGPEYPYLLSGSEQPYFKSLRVLAEFVFVLFPKLTTSRSYLAASNYVDRCK